MKRKILFRCFINNFIISGCVTASAQVLNEGTFKFGRTLSLIDDFYVDTVNLDVSLKKQ